MNTKNKFTGRLNKMINAANKGTTRDVDFILQQLDKDSNLVTTRFVDYALSCVSNAEGIQRIEYYLFNGTKIQRNYCSLYFNRRVDWKIVKKAYEMGLIDEVQAYAR